ncbi:gamma-aminobutyric acid receptor subunit beta [Eurytemora carolleeae]|uniref:gamma-aminobutyric acid receptor subunit beta n=1 Tax=Eurytemora carolleeae TaxID=1294199 RepID=UPI000C7640A5|nr:gamma-aminobutyric acid receptor subunit beta [Eurytemora carolleeae]|eukprot:XP_023347543.1 gamma-aminobutyric acid receptor subunit beta-like [Eurytemora affinis]
MNTKETVSVYIEQGITPRLEMLDNEGRKIIRKTHHQLQGRKPSGNYSALEIEFHLTRQIGHYIIDYYVPSALLVTLSWISFWLDPNAVPGRVTLGTATWLSFITMTKTTGSDQLPRVSYIKFLDIWFLSCTVFIFASLLEFALVNIIWRRKEHVTMSRITGKEILLEGFKELGRSALTTPSYTRRNSQAEQEKRLGSENRRNSAPSAQSRKVSTLSLNELAVSFPSFNFQSANNISNNNNSFSNYNINNNNSFSNNSMNNKNRSLSTSSSPHSEPFQFYVSEPDPDMQEVILPVPSFHQEGEKRTGKVLWGNAANALIRKRKNNRTTVKDEEDGKEKDEPVNIMEQFQSMSYEEIAIWIDTKARIVFPLMFLLFVIMYSIFVVYADLLPSSTTMAHT